MEVNIVDSLNPSIQVGPFTLEVSFEKHHHVTFPAILENSTKSTQSRSIQIVVQSQDYLDTSENSIKPPPSSSQIVSSIKDSYLIFPTLNGNTPTSYL